MDDSLFKKLAKFFPVHLPILIRSSFQVFDDFCEDRVQYYVVPKIGTTVVVQALGLKAGHAIGPGSSKLRIAGLHYEH